MHHLFTALSPEYRQRLESLPTALDTVAPLRTAHRRDLPMAIRDLSQMLTSERGALSDPYWAAPRLLSAYLRYFMPWNLVRLGRLLPSLELVDREALLERPLILDLGSGPLTLPLALWLARPDLRGLPLTFLCADIAPHPLEVGRDLLQVIAGEESPWALRTLRAPMEAALKEARGDAALILAGNVLNELKSRRDEPLEYRMEELAEMAGSALAHGGRILVIEPGTRLGARYVTQFRRAAMEVGLAPLAPCPHHDQCPLLETGGPGGWCHFTFPIQGAPAWLEELSRRAKLEKGTASLSFVTPAPNGAWPCCTMRDRCIPARPSRSPGPKWNAATASPARWNWNGPRLAGNPRTRARRTRAPRASPRGARPRAVRRRCPALRTTRTTCNRPS